MALLQKSDAEKPVQDWAYDLVNTDESICARIAEAGATGVGLCDLQIHSVWRGERGKPNFSATLYFDGEDYWPSVLSDTIIAEVTGTFQESRSGLKVDHYVMGECDFDKRNADAANAYWEEKSRKRR